MTDKEIDELYDTAMLLMQRGRWSLIDDLLEYYGNAAWRMDLDLLLGWATATNMCRKQLKNRKLFMEQCRTLHSDPELWKGLWEDDTDPNPFLKQLGLANVVSIAGH